MGTAAARVRGSIFIRGCQLRAANSQPALCNAERRGGIFDFSSRGAATSFRNLPCVGTPASRNGASAGGESATTFAPRSSGDVAARFRRYARGRSLAHACRLASSQQRMAAITTVSPSQMRRMSAKVSARLDISQAPYAPAEIDLCI